MFCQNDQIHNNLYLTVENSIEIGKGYQVIEKWVFFKLLLQPYKQTPLGVRITVLPKILYIFLQGKFKESNQILSKSNITILNTEKINPLFSFCFRQLIGCHSRTYIVIVVCHRDSSVNFTRLQYIK